MRRKAIGVLIGSTVLAAVVMFLAPAVREARRAALRSQCQNNLKSIGLGLWNYSQANDSLPPGTVANGSLPPEKRLSWIVCGMPHMLCMHCCGMNADIAWDKSWDAAENRSLSVTPVFLLNCPSSRSASAEEQSAGNYVNLAVKRDLHPSPYIGLAGVGRDAPLLPKQSPRAGVFGYDRVTRLADIKDGASATMIVAETSVTAGAWTAGGSATVRGIDQSQRPYIGQGRQFGGNHIGGAMVLFADGSVRFVRESIDPKIFDALSTISGGESVADGWDQN